MRVATGRSIRLRARAPFALVVQENATVRNDSCTCSQRLVVGLRQMLMEVYVEMNPDCTC